MIFLYAPACIFRGWPVLLGPAEPCLDRSKPSRWYCSRVFSISVQLSSPFVRPTSFSRPLRSIVAQPRVHSSLVCESRFQLLRSKALKNLELIYCILSPLGRTVTSLSLMGVPNRTGSMHSGTDTCQLSRDSAVIHDLAGYAGKIS